MLTELAAKVRSTLSEMRDEQVRRGSDSNIRGRVTADRDDEIVVFLIGMRINSFPKVHRWLPILFAGPRLVRELRREQSGGLLGSWTFVSPPRTIGFVQYWESFDSLREYAHDGDGGHPAAWRAYSERAADGAVGIWHETYCVKGHETIYNNVPPRGLGAAAGSDLAPASGLFDSATGRLSAEGSDGPDGSGAAADRPGGVDDRPEQPSPTE